MSRSSRIAKERAHGSRGNMNRNITDGSIERYHARYSDRDPLRGASHRALGAAWCQANPKAFNRLKRQIIGECMDGNGGDLYPEVFAFLRYSGSVIRCDDLRQAAGMAHGVCQQLKRELPNFIHD